MLSSAALFFIVSPNARKPVLYRASLKILATRANLITRTTSMAPETVPPTMPDREIAREIP